MVALQSSAAMVFNAVAGLYLLAVLLRFLLQLAGADFYNPVSQAVVRISEPMVRLFRSFLPGYRGTDFSSLVLALVVEAVAIVSLSILYGYPMPSVSFIVTWAFLGVVYFVIAIYYYALIVSIIMSFVMLLSGNMNPHPALRLLWQLTEPVMAPIRKVIPPMGGLDFSPIFIFIAIGLIKNLLIQTFGISGQIVDIVIGI